MTKTVAGAAIRSILAERKGIALLVEGIRPAAWQADRNIGAEDFAPARGW